MEIKFDTHTHCSFSHDSSTPAQKMIEGAIAKGLKYLAITDHCDKDCVVLPGYDWVRQIDLPARFDCLRKLRETYKDDIYLAIGLEFGFEKQANSLYLDINKEYSTDYIINSVHIVQGVDVYFEEFYNARTKAQAYTQYLICVNNSIDVPYHYDSIGHIGYIARKANYKDKKFIYSDYSDLVDEIFKKIIQKGKALELNTHAKGTLCDFIPYKDFLKRYKELGGELVTIGSDSHTPDRLCENFDIVKNALIENGFKYAFVYKNHTACPVSLTKNN